MVSPTFDQMHFYSTGRYGLIDSFYRHVWLNLPDESMAHRIRKVFWSKSTMIVFDLTCFDNYSDTTVDSDVSLDWKIQLENRLPMDITTPIFIERGEWHRLIKGTGKLVLKIIKSYE